MRLADGWAGSSPAVTAPGEALLSSRLGLHRRRDRGERGLQLLALRRRLAHQRGTHRLSGLRRGAVLPPSTRSTSWPGSPMSCRSMSSRSAFSRTSGPSCSQASARLVELADRVNVLQVEALCWCGKRATHNARTENGEMVTEGDVIVVGDVDDEGPAARGSGLRGAVPTTPPAPAHRCASQGGGALT